MFCEKHIALSRLISVDLLANYTCIVPRTRAFHWCTARTLAFNHYCTAHGTVSLYFTMGRHSPEKLSIFFGAGPSPSNTWFFGSVAIQRCNSVLLTILWLSTCWTNPIGLLVQHSYFYLSSGLIQKYITKKKIITIVQSNLAKGRTVLPAIKISINRHLTSSSVTAKELSVSRCLESRDSSRRSSKHEHFPRQYAVYATNRSQYECKLCDA